MAGFVHVFVESSQWCEDGRIVKAHLEAHQGMIGAAKDGHPVQDVVVLALIGQTVVDGEGTFVTGLFYQLLQFL